MNARHLGGMLFSNKIIHLQYLSHATNKKGAHMLDAFRESVLGYIDYGICEACFSFRIHICVFLNETALIPISSHLMM